MTTPNPNRRGFLTGLLAAGPAAYIATKSKKPPTPKALKQKDAWLTEEATVWQLGDGTRLPVQHIKLSVPFIPEFDVRVIVAGQREHRIVPDRKSELLWREAYSRRFWNTAGPVIDRSPVKDVPMPDILRHALESHHSLWVRDTSKRTLQGQIVEGAPQGLLVEIDTPQGRQYSVCVCPYVITSEHLYIRTPATNLFT